MDWTTQFRTYTEACEYYGADTPANIEFEMLWEAHVEYTGFQDKMEAQGGPTFGACADWNDELPF